MTPAATPPEQLRPRLLAGLSLAAVLFAVALTGGCSKPPPPPGDSKDDPSGVPKGKPWEVAGARLKKGTDLPTCKLVLTALRADTATESEKLPALSEEKLNDLAAVAPLAPTDREEIRGGAFSEHDAAYLAECFYLRDAARSLALTGLPPERQAELAFAWVCRQVYLQPWPRYVGRDQRGHELFEPTALPPTAVLRRGFGSGLERMYVFLALLQQLELDACLIGGPDAGNIHSRDGKELKYPFITQVSGFQRGPFWAVGVKVGTDVRLFDPWRGEPFPVTLNQLKANPDAAKAWFEDKANISGATLDDAKKATAFLAVPVNALSARMAMFEARLKGDIGANVAIDAKALRDSFPDPKPTFWNPPTDPFAYGRVLRFYLPVELGGADKAPVAVRLYEASLRAQVPASAVEPSPEIAAVIRPLGDSARQRITDSAFTVLAATFVEPPNPRERIQRGQYQEAAREAVAKQEVYASGLERLRVNKDAATQTNEWIEEIKRLRQAASKANQEKDKPAEDAAFQAIEKAWTAPGVQFLIDRIVAEVGFAESSYLLALCKHEEAERVQVRVERAAGAEAVRVKADAADAWKTALSSWRAYEQSAAAHAGFPGRAEHAKVLTARAAQLVAASEKK